MNLNIHGVKALRLSLVALPLLTLAGVLARAQSTQQNVEAASAKTWVGRKAVSFILPGLDGKPVDMSKQLGKHPFVLVFYRGVW